MVLWGADFYANIASGLTAFALGIYMFEMTSTATSVALTVLFAFLPAVLLNPFAGVLADRFDRRLMMIIGDGCSALGLIYILLCISSGNVYEWQIYLGVGINSVFIALLEPAFKATITDLLSKDEFAKASGLVQIAGSSKFLLSPFIAGFLLTITDIKAILLIDITTIAVTIPATLFIKKQLAVAENSRDDQSFLKDFAEGFQVISSNTGLLLMILIISLVTFYMGLLQTLYTPLMLGITDAQTLGIIESVSAVGMLVGSILMGVFTITRKYVKQLVIGLVFTGVFIALLGAITSILIIGLSGFLFFATLPFINTSADVLTRTNIPDDKQGRVWGLIGILSQFGYVVAYGVSGLLADHVFDPLLVENGILASTIGSVIGVGSGRGIGFMLIISGILLVITAVILGRLPAISNLERNMTS